MSNSYTRLHHIVWAIDTIHEFGTLDLTDKKTFAAVVYFLQIIGEASKKIKPEIKNLAPEIPWKNIMAFRDYAAHEYFALDVEAVGEAVKSLPHLKTTTQRLIKITLTGVP